jgi:hypothetical protein
MGTTTGFIDLKDLMISVRINPVTSPAVEGGISIANFDGCKPIFRLALFVAPTNIQSAGWQNGDTLSLVNTVNTFHVQKASLHKSTIIFYMKNSISRPFGDKIDNYSHAEPC